MNDQTTLADAVARAFRDHGITAELTALIGGSLGVAAGSNFTGGSVRIAIHYLTLGVPN